MSVKDRIKELCKKNKISVNRLEKELGFATGYISKLDKSTPNTKKIQIIADYFDVSLDYLMTGEEKINAFKTGQEHAELLRMYEMLNNEEKEQVVNMIKLFIKNK